MSNNYAYRKCANCGQVVAHTKSGRPLHMHYDSAKCERNGAFIRGDVRGRTTPRRSTQANSTGTAGGTDR